MFHPLNVNTVSRTNPVFGIEMKLGIAVRPFTMVPSGIRQDNRIRDSEILTDCVDTYIYIF